MKPEECIFSTTSQLVNLWRLHLTKPTALLTATALFSWKRPCCTAHASSGRHRETWMDGKWQEPPLELSPSPGCGCVGVVLSLTNVSLAGKLCFRRGCPHGSAPLRGPSRRGSGRRLPGPPAPRVRGTALPRTPAAGRRKSTYPGRGPPRRPPPLRAASRLLSREAPPRRCSRSPPRGGRCSPVAVPPLPSLAPSLPPAAAAAAAAAPVPPPRPPPRPALPHPGPGAAVTMVMAEGTAVLRRNRPGTKAQDFYNWPDESFEEMDSTLAVQQYIQQNIRADCSNIDKILEPPEGQDEGVWKYEHLRQFCLELNGLAVKLQSECHPDTCTQMTATEQWIFLCAAHKTPKECPAIDYTRHTLDGAACLLNSNKYFPSRVSIKESSVAKLGSVCRRIYRIFSHAYFHHRQIFDEYENETFLCHRFTKFVMKYNLMSKDNLIVPILEEEVQNSVSGESEA
uniref:MOB-like protein phocein n=1 Tax=Aquila chrysaetos chrysaetos TaxID=223781 RepID=A0A663DTN1_AQUCH